jgi:hypothetical protein
MALGLAQPLTGLNTRNLLWGGGGGGVKRGRHIRLTTSQSSVSRLSRKYGVLDVSQPYGRPHSVTEIAFLIAINLLSLNYLQFFNLLSLIQVLSFLLLFCYVYPFPVCHDMCTKF